MDPCYAWAISDRSRALWNMGRNDKAIADFSRAIDLEPCFAKALGSRGMGYLALGRFEEGIADLSRAIDMDPRRLRTAAIRTVAPRSSARRLQHAAWPRPNRQ
jgi:tetratricopeptide (TPR) repeat protein